MQTLDIETKFLAGGPGEIEGYASVFNTAPDAYGDVIAPGAFKRSLAADSRPAMLWSHDPAEVIGVWDVVEEDGHGLFVKGRLVLETARGKEAHALLKAGALGGLSIGFRTVVAESSAGGGRTLTDIELHEISIVTFPAQSAAGVTDVKDISMTDDLNTRADDADTDGLTVVVADVADLKERVSRLEGTQADASKSLGRIEAKMNRPGAAAAPDAPAGAVERKAFAAFLQGGVERMAAHEVKTLHVSSDTAGGYLVPDDFRGELIKNLVEISPVRQAARAMRTGRDKVTLPMRTGTLTASWVGETAARSQSEPAYGQQVIEVFEAGCYVDASNAMLEDSAIDVAAELRRDFTEEFGRLEGDVFINGDGGGKPQGFLAGGVPTITAALSPDALIDLFHDLPSFYRSRAVWMMNSAAIGEVRKMKDAAGAYLWQEAVSEANPATILGRPVIEAADMPAPAGGAQAIAFGDFGQGYRIIDRVDMAILRDPYTVQVNGLVRFHARRRVGGAVVKAEALRTLTLA